MLKRGNLCKVIPGILSTRVICDAQKRGIGKGEIKIPEGTIVEVLDIVVPNSGFNDYLFIWVPSLQVYVSFYASWLELISK